MKTVLDLKELGPRFAILDHLLVSVIKNRMDLAERVAAYKIPTQQPIVRAKVENSRLMAMRKAARELRMNPHFINALAYLIIDESCKLQAGLYHRANRAKRKPSEPKDEEDLRLFYRKNLLALTKSVAAIYDDQYDGPYFATHAYTEYEERLIEREVVQLQHREVLLDLGCATGRMTIALASRFSQAVGYDISPHMLRVARAHAEAKGIGNTKFEQIDVENRLPLAGASVSFVVMNMGTGSDVFNLEGLLKEVRRVLQPGGRFLFSFYNKEALIYAWDFLPWPVGLAAEINLRLQCLEVHKKGKILSIYARPYTVDEATEMFQKGLVATEISTYPTVSAILPKELLSSQPAAQQSIAALDQVLTTSNKGAYIVVTGVRT